MLTRFIALTTSIVVGTIGLVGLVSTAHTAAAEDGIDRGFRDAMVEFLIVQDAARDIEDQMTHAIAQQTLASIAAGGIEINQPLQDIVMDVARTSVGARFGDVDYLAELYAPLYAQHYSESELRELSAFWRSPLGKKTIAAMPKLTEGSSRVLQQASAAIVPAFKAALEKRLEAAEIETAR